MSKGEAEKQLAEIREEEPAMDERDAKNEALAAAFEPIVQANAHLARYGSISMESIPIYISSPQIYLDRNHPEGQLSS